MATLSDLPTELLDGISECLDKQDLRTVRHSSSCWVRPAARCMFPRAVLSDSQCDIEHFEGITGNSEVRKYARELVLDISTFNPDLLDFQCFLGMTDLHSPDCLRDSPNNEGHVKDSESMKRWYAETRRECRDDCSMVRQRQVEIVTDFFEWFQERAQKHIANRQSNAAFEALRNAIASGWKVERIIVTSLPAGQGHGNRPDEPFQQPVSSPATREWEEKKAATRGPIPWDEIEPRVGWMTFDNQLSEILHMANSGNNLDGWLNARESWQQWRQIAATGQPSRCFHAKAVGSPYRGLSMILQILEDTKRLDSISELSVIPSRKFHPDCCHCGDAMSAAIFLTDGPDMKRLLQLAQNLKVLRLVTEAVSDSDQTHFEYPGLRGLLQQGSKVLEELYLEFIRHGEIASDRNLLRGLGFERLRKMHLYEVRFTDVELFTFLLENKHCLRVLIISYCWMLDEKGAMIELDDGTETDLEATGWWWPLLDELRGMGCFEEMELYIDSVAQQRDTLAMEGEPQLAEGMARWKAWTAGGKRFPLLGGCPEQDPSLVDKIPARYRQQLRSGLAPGRE